MSKVIFSDVVRRANTKEDKDNTEKEFYIGGEHIDSNEVLITKQGVIAGSTIGPMFYFGFSAGQVLLVSRNPHLRKAGLVTFDGICSEKTFVLESIDEGILLQRYLPFVLQSDHFWAYAEANKSGSVNFFLNWSTLAKYEFELPSISKQKELSDLLWSINDTKLAYKNLIPKTDELVTSQFIEMFGDITSHSKYPVVELGAISEMISGGTPSSKHPEYYGGDIPFVSTPCLGPNYIDASAAQNWLTELGVQKSSTNKIPAYSLLFGNRVGVGKSSINTCEMCTNQDILSFINIDPKNYDLIFIKNVLNQYASYYESQKRGATIKGISSELVKASKIPCAPIDIQKQFAAFVKQSDKSKFELKHSIETTEALYRSILAENFS